MVLQASPCHGLIRFDACRQRSTLAPSIQSGFSRWWSKKFSAGLKPFVERYLVPSSASSANKIVIRRNSMMSCSKRTGRSAWPRCSQPRLLSRSITGWIMNTRKPRWRSIWAIWSWSTSSMRSWLSLTIRVEQSAERMTPQRKNQKWK